LIQISRLLAKQLRSMVKMLLPRRGPMPALTFRAGQDGLFIEVQGANQALQYHDPQPREQEQLLVPFNVLEDVQGSKPEPVYLNTRRDGVLGANWEDKGIGRDLEYDAPEPVADAPPFPTLPETFSENPPALLAALREGYETTDAESSRYALASIQVRGREGVIAATDGRQLLKQSGFMFGFDEELLLHQTKFFASKHLPVDQPMRVGKSGDKSVVFQIGPWSVWLPVVEGRFPDVDRIVPPSDFSKATLQLAAADAKFLTENLHRLPNGTANRELTLDLNGRVVLRASAPDTLRPTEMVLRNSSKRGDDVLVCTDRKFLARAAGMGFTEVELPDNTSPAVARDASRVYLWMVLDPKEAIKPTSDCLCIESPLYSSHRCSTSLSRKATPMNRIASQPAGQPAASAPSQNDPPAALKRASTRSCSASSPRRPGGAYEQAVVVRDQLRSTLAAVKDLIRQINIEKRSQKSLKSALASLKQLQQVA
jgi:hypothetical protein